MIDCVPGSWNYSGKQNIYCIKEVALRLQTQAKCKCWKGRKQTTAVNRRWDLAATWVNLGEALRGSHVSNCGVEIVRRSTRLSFPVCSVGFPPLRSGMPRAGA